MPSGDICTANIGTPVPLAYGYFRATGMQPVNYTVPATTDVPLGTYPAGLQVGLWDLGEGELDGIDALWINNVLQFAFDSGGNLMGQNLVGVAPTGSGTDTTATTPTLNFFGFHTGCDAPVGGGPGTSSVMQWIDPIWTQIQPAGLVTRLCYSRRCYYSIGWTPATNDSSTLAPVGDFRGMRCRIFDANGNQLAYRFTTNPIWHAVDLWLRRAIKPDYAIDSALGPTALTADEASCFNWPSIAAAAAYCDYVLPNGMPRFMGSYVFAKGSTLQAMLEQVFLCCRGYQFEYAGQIYMFIDQPRASTFTVSGAMLVPGSFEADNAQVNQNANRYVANFCEIGLPAVANISTIARTSSGIVIHTTSPDPCAQNDVISVGGVVDPTFDACYEVSSTPSSTEVDCTITGGVAGSSTGGSIGYIQSRFSQRAPELSHGQHQMAQGQVLPPNVTGTRLKRIKVTYDFGNMTYDQANRLLKYEIYRDLGIDYLNPTLLQQLFGSTALLNSPYQPPLTLTLSLWSESVDAAGNAAKAQLQGSRITLDSTVFCEFAGDYEIIDRWPSPMQQEVEDSTDGNFVQAVSRTGGMAAGTDSNSGILKLSLRTYNPNVFFDVSDAPNASFATVPGYLPYAGPSGSGSGGSGGGGGGGSVGGTVVGGTLSVYVAYGAVPQVSWTGVQVRFANGIEITFTNGSTQEDMTTSANVVSGQDYYFYANDPSFSAGGLGVYSVPPATGPGVVQLLQFSMPLTPHPGMDPNTVTFYLI